MKCADLLVKLYTLNDDWAFVAEQKSKGIAIRKPLGGEKHRVVDWVKQQFGAGWASEADIAMSGTTRTCFIAIQNEQIIGFCCYDTSALGFCGPLGVDANYRAQGTGKALLLACLLDMKLKGYGYAIMGWVPEQYFSFYEKSVQAAPILDSYPGIYAGYLRGSGNPSA